jgi:hypothetical protein
MKFSKSILRTVAIDGGVGLSDTTRIIDLIDEFNERMGQIDLCKWVSGGLCVAVLLGLLSGGSVPMLAASMVFMGGGLGASLKHKLSYQDKRELALLQRQRSIIGLLAELEQKVGIEQTLTRYEEIITGYSLAEGCFYLEGDRHEPKHIRKLLGLDPTPNAQRPTPVAEPWSLERELNKRHAVPVPQPMPVTAGTADAQWEPEEDNPFGDDPMDHPSAMWMDDLISYPVVLIHGAQGSGKTTLATWVLNKRRQLGHEVEVLDPHRKYGQWEGFKTHGDAMDYPAIDSRLEAFYKEVKTRYALGVQTPNYNPPLLTVAAEEFTNWADRCRNSAEFFKSALSDIRKINMHVLFIAHDRSLASLGGTKGTSATRDKTLLEVELFSQVDPVTGKASPTGKGTIKYPGGEPVAITIPELFVDSLASEVSRSSTLPQNPNFRLSVAESPENEPETDIETDLETDFEGSETSAEFVPKPPTIDPTNEEISMEERFKVISLWRQGLTNKVKLLKQVWDVNPGGSKGYSIARKSFT